MNLDVIVTVLTWIGVLFVIRLLLERFRRDISNQLSGLLSDLSDLSTKIGKMSA